MRTQDKGKGGELTASGRRLAPRPILPQESGNVCSLYSLSAIIMVENSLEIFERIDLRKIKSQLVCLSFNFSCQMVDRMKENIKAFLKSYEKVESFLKATTYLVLFMLCLYYIVKL